MNPGLKSSRMIYNQSEIAIESLERRISRLDQKKLIVVNMLEGDSRL